MKKFKQHLFALFTMVMGTALVMGLVYMMNEATTTPPKADQKDAVAFQVDKKPPPKKVRKRTPLAETNAPHVAPGLAVVGCALGSTEAAVTLRETTDTSTPRLAAMLPTSSVRLAAS